MMAPNGPKNKPLSDPASPRKQSSDLALAHGEEGKRRKQVFKSSSKFLPTERGDVVGIDGILEEADTIIDWVNNVGFYRKHEARLEPGVIFYGSPGTGKTLVSRYIATQTAALFIDVRDWPYRGPFPVAEDIAALFQMARKTYSKNQRPIILFWDEFETIAQDRAKAS